eukprot:COSAG06_NODE_14566_length_1146_cov_1.703916_2_plen_99_part_01
MSILWVWRPGPSWLVTVFVKWGRWRATRVGAALCGLLSVGSGIPTPVLIVLVSCALSLVTWSLQVLDPRDGGRGRCARRKVDGEGEEEEEQVDPTQWDS